MKSSIQGDADSFGTALIRSIPVGGAHFVVTIDGRPYAGFITRGYAEKAIRLWMGEADEVSSSPEQGRAYRWEAVRGRVLAIVERW